MQLVFTHIVWGMEVQKNLRGTLAPLRIGTWLTHRNTPLPRVTMPNLVILVVKQYDCYLCIEVSGRNCFPVASRLKVIEMTRMVGYL